MAMVIRYGILMVVLSFLTAYLNRLQEQKAARYVREDGSHEVKYFVRIPKELSYVYGMMVGMGVLLFVVFSIAKITGASSITMGHFVFCFIFSMIGVLVCVWANSWGIGVNEARGVLECRKLLHGSTEYGIYEISGVELDEKGNYRIYVHGKKLVQVDGLCTNSEYLLAYLKAQGFVKDIK